MHFERRRVNGSLTIEASLVMALVLFTMAVAARVAIGLCGEVKTAAEEAVVAEYEPVKILHGKLLLDGITKGDSDEN